jgi:hypothetical protein
MSQAPNSSAQASAAELVRTQLRTSVPAVARRLATVRPAYVLAPLVVAQWAVTVALGLTATHNGWLFYHGGDGTYYWTSTWSIAHHHVPEAVISYGLPVAFWPLGLVFGPNMLPALPAIVAFQVLVLAPLGILALYGLAARIGGRLFAYAAVAAWVLAPAIALSFFNAEGLPYRSRAHDLVLPNALGLTSLADYTSMILALVATYLIVRALDDRRWNDVVLAGLTTGTLIAVKPSNGYYLVAPLLAFALSRRWREGLAFFALLVPALVTLAVWKKIGLGTIPALSAPDIRVAAGSGLAPQPASLNRYFPFDWDTFSTNLDQLREVGWSLRLVEWLTIAGILGLVRRAPVYGVMVGAWFTSYLLFKGGASGRASVEQMSFFRFIMPAFPAFVLLALSIVFLVPGTRRRGRVVATPVAPTATALVAALVLAVYPLALVATAKASPAGQTVKDPAHNLLVPVSDELRATATATPDSVKLSWRMPDYGATRVYFRIYRSAGTGCDQVASGAQTCLLRMEPAGVTTRRRFVDWWPPPGEFTYRIGLIAGWTRELRHSDLLLIGPPINVKAKAARRSAAASG